MEMWMKITWALLLGAMIIFLWPRTKQMLNESRGATGDDWKSVALPIGLVILFVIFLIAMVR